MSKSKSESEGGGPWFDGIREDAWSIFGGWVNELTGRGDPERDKGAANAWVGGVLLPCEHLRSVYAFNGLGRAICNALPEWAIRNGWDLSVERDAVEAKQVESGVRAKLDELGAHEAMLRAAVWGQLYGGGLVLVGADDGGATSEPLNLGAIREIRFLRVVPRSDVQIVGVFDRPDRPGFGEAAVYEVTERVAGLASSTVTRWHASRVIRFGGPLTDTETQRMNDGWDVSILDHVLAGLGKHEAMWDNVGAAIEDASQGVWKIEGLAAAASTGLADKIEARLRLADKARAQFRSLLLDAAREDFDYVHREFGGVADLITASAVRVSGIAQIPVTVLMGQSPAGLNATGDSDLELWYARVQAYQSAKLAPRFGRLVRLVLLSKSGPTGGVEPDAWAVSMADPRNLTPMQRVELRARQAQVDTAMITARVITPEEVAINRYTSEGWSDVTAIDLGWRRSFLGFASRILASADGGAFARLLEAWLGTVAAAPSPGPDAPPVVAPSGSEAPTNAATGAVE